jgi:hypothetical protein
MDWWTNKVFNQDWWTNKVINGLMDKQGHEQGHEWIDGSTRSSMDLFFLFIDSREPCAVIKLDQRRLDQTTTVFMDWWTKKVMNAFMDQQSHQWIDGPTRSSMDSWTNKVIYGLMDQQGHQWTDGLTRSSIDWWTKEVINGLTTIQKPAKDDDNEHDDNHDIQV